MSEPNMIACRAAMTDALIELAAEDTDVVAITSDARGSAALKKYVSMFPAQFVECGIAEQNEISVAAGMARTGKKPFVCAPAAFLSSRSLEQIKVDVAYSETNVKVLGVSGGVSYGPLGGSHYCTQDIASIRSIPGITVLIPADGPQTAWAIHQLHKTDSPAYLRIGRNPVPVIYDTCASLQWGKAFELNKGNDVTIIACGQMVYYALQAAQILSKSGIRARVLDMYMVKPIDREAVIRAACETKGIVTVEEHVIRGGMGSAVAEVVVEEAPVKMKLMGIPDGAFSYGSQLYMFDAMGLTAAGIASAAENLIA